MRMTNSEKVFNITNISFFVLFSIICIYPFIYVTALAFNDGVDAMRGGIYFLPRVWTLKNFITIFQDKRLFTSFLISVFRTVVGTSLSVVLNSCFAFAVAKRDLPGRKFINWFILVPMYFGGGIIPFYLVCKMLHLTNNLLVYIIPGLITPFYILLLRVFYLGMSDSLEESAIIDGAGYFTIFFKLYFPLSVPALATVALLTGIDHWNDWFTGSVMFYSSKMWPLQTLLLNIVQGSDILQFLKGEAINSSMAKKPLITPESIKMAVLVVTVVPIVIVYPFLQKYFVKGMMIGSIKG